MAEDTTTTTTTVEAKDDKSKEVKGTPGLTDANDPVLGEGQQIDPLEAGKADAQSNHAASMDGTPQE